MRRIIQQSHLALLLGVFVMMPAIAAAQTPATSDQEVTFTRDVAPIFQRSCVTCHRPNQIAPMSLISYQEVRPWARSIRNRVSTRVMPPWHLDRRIGIQDFKIDPSLTDEEIATIVQWVDAGAPRGNPADMPPLREFADADAWQNGEPELIVRFPDLTVPAAGPDIFGNIIADFNLDEDRYITAIQTKPVGDLSRQVVHHALSYAVEQNEEGESMGRAMFLVEYASGKQAELYPPGSGLLLPAGKKQG